MAHFSKRGIRNVPAVSTASLPDIIFTLLFFFMVAANVKDNVVKVKQTPPKVVDTKKLSKQDRPKTIYIGYISSLPENLSKEKPVIQLNGKLLEVDDISAIQDFALHEISTTKTRDRDKIVFNLKADEDVSMHIIRQVKEQLQKGAKLANQDFIRVNYYSNTKKENQ